MTKEEWDNLKVGDVVYYNGEWDETVEQVVHFMSCGSPQFKTIIAVSGNLKVGDVGGIEPLRCELLPLYNSPLYKAMSEDD